MDTLFSGRLTIRQPEKGYRFSMDSILLAGLTRWRKQDRVVDLGCGCGVIPLVLAYRRAVSHITGIEIQPSLAELARRNMEIGGFVDSIHIIQGDLRTVARDAVPGPITVVISNPPYRELHSGRLNPDSEKAVARHQILATLADVIGAADRLLPQRGRLALIYPARRLSSLFMEVEQGGFAPKELTLIHTYLNSPAKLAHLESVKGGGEELTVHKPFAIYREDGSYSDEMAALYRED